MRDFLIRATPAARPLPAAPVVLRALACAAPCPGCVAAGFSRRSSPSPASATMLARSRCTATQLKAAAPAVPWACVTSSAGTRIGSFAAQVDLVTLGVEVGASRLLQDKVARQPNMTVTTNHAVKAFRGMERLEEVVVEDQATGEEKTWDYDGVFVFIGLSPNTALLQGKADLDDREFAVTDDRLRTTLPGVFAAGDVRAGPTKQAASAVGEGATAALMMREHLRRIG